MRLLLIGVLLGLLQGTFEEGFYNNAFFQRFPFQLRKPFVQDYYKPPLSPDFFYQPQRRSDDYEGIITPFHRGHVESPSHLHPTVLVKSRASNHWRIPLRDAVQKVPIQGEMNRLLKSSFEDNGENNPFSRSHVEAFPKHKSSFGITAESIRSQVYSSPDVNIDAPLIGYRAAVESPPSSTSQNNFYYNRIPNDDIDTEDLWSQKFSDEIVPSLYSSWNNPVVFRKTDGDQKVVCYFQSWAVYRPKPLDFDIKDIDPFACTHIIYAFAGIHKENFTIMSLDDDRDVLQGAYKALVALKARNLDLKVLIAVGGYEEGGRKYSEMVSTKETRKRFIDSVVRFIEEHAFDGLDLNWEYPGAADRGGKQSDRENLALLLEELYPILKEKSLILTLAAPIDKGKISDGFDISRLSRSVDFFNLMAYDLRSPFDRVADHHAPLEKRKTDIYIHKGLNLKEGVQLFLDHGAPAYKLVVGVPFYGRTFTLENPKENTPGSKIVNVGKEGRFTRQKGYLAYYEICMEQRNGGWDISRDEAGGTYMVKGDQWVGYDDEDYIEKKVDYIKYENLGGVMLWSMDLDDYLGLCGTRWPLLSALRASLHIPKTTTTSEIISAAASSLDEAVRATSPSVPFQEITPAEKVHSLSGPSEGDSCSGSETIRSSRSCQEFLICNQGAYTAKRCGAGLHWNDREKICDWPDNAKCKGIKRPPKVPVKPPTGESFPEEVSTPQTQTYPSVSLEPAPSAGPLSGDFMVVCYFTNWAWYRSGSGKFLPDDIDESICTHIVYGFAVLDYSNLIIKPHDSWADIDNRFYERVTALRAKGIKVTIAIGGWNDSAGDKYSRLVHSPSSRARFIEHVVGFIKKHNFDGLDLDWEYPVCWQVDCKKGPASDKEEFSAFVRELSAAFKPHGLLLSAAVSPNKVVIDKGYDVPTLNRYLDWIAVMTYDFHGHWDKKTGHVAPMYYHPEDDNDFFNMDYAIRYWIEKGGDKKKIVLGMPLYGQAFTLNDASVNGLNAPANLKGRAGTYTKAPGFLAYYEICKSVTRDGWNVVKDPEGRMGPYAYKGNQWVSYDDVATIRKKSQYIRDNGLGGGMVWALDLDDFNNVCGQGKYPLMKTIQSVLGPADTGSPGMMVVQTQRPPHSVPQHPNRQPVPSHHAPPQPQLPPVIDFPVHVSPIGADDNIVVCSFTNWAWYREGEGMFLPENIDSQLCTHIIYGFATLDETELIMRPSDIETDINNNFYSRILEFKKAGIKVLISLGGWNDSGGDKFSRLVNNPEARKKFNEHALSFVQQYGFDGLDLDWEFPKCWQTDCTRGPMTDKEGFTAWIRELSALFKPYRYLLSAVVSPSREIVPYAYDVGVLSTYLDFINVMTYDYHGQWDNKTGHVAPIYSHPGDDDPTQNLNFTISYWIKLGADPKKLVLGMPLYGQSFTLENSNNNGLNAPTVGGGKAGPYTRAMGFLAYYEICHSIKYRSWNVVRDSFGTMGPYAYLGNQWVGFDDVKSIQAKAEYVKQMGLRGAFIWALDFDDFVNRCLCDSYPLLKTINRVLRNYPSPKDECPMLGESSQGQPQTTRTPTSTSTPSSTRPHFIVASTLRQKLTQTPPPPPPSPLPVQEAPQGQSVGMAGKPCIAGEFRPHHDCSKFYECYQEKLREVSCYRGLHHKGMGKCDRPEVANCKGIRVRPESFPSVVTPSMSEPDFVIETRPEHPIAVKQGSDFGTEGEPCSNGAFKRHPECNKFYQCLHGKLTERRCLPGLNWDGQGKCAWPEKAKCVEGRPGHTSPPLFPVTHIKHPPKAVTTTPSTTMTTTTTTTTTTAKATTTTSRPSTVRSSTQWYVPWTPSTEPTTPRPTHPPGSLEIEGYKVVCYFTNWAWYRQGAAKYKPEDIDPDLCTHIIYGFAVLDTNKLLIKPHDTWADYDNKFYQKVTGLKAKGIRVLLAIGGWNDSKGSKYSRLVNDPSARAKFIEHVVQFIEKHNFDGLDLDWEYPKCWQVDCKAGPASDKDGFSAWIRELRAAFNPRNWLLTAAVSPSYKVIEAGYHVKDLTDYLDFVNVMTYDYHGHWDKQTGHVAPMLHHPESPAPEFNANYTINYFIEKGANPKKLIMGMPMYGQSFSLTKIDKTGLNSPARKGQAGEYTRAAGFLAYYEICHKVLSQGYKVMKDPSGSIGPYAYKGNQWVGFDDVNMIRFKSEYIKNMGLGGGMIWALDLDDFRNRCNCESHPLLKTINRVLRNYPEATVDCSLG